MTTERKRTTVLRFKRRRAKAGTSVCDACGWKPPAALEILSRDGRADILNAHHVVPINRRGEDDESNLLLLCPNCHALAHAMERHHFSLPLPPSPLQLLRAIKLLITDDAAFRQLIESDRPPLRKASRAANLATALAYIAGGGDA